MFPIEQCCNMNLILLLLNIGLLIENFSCKSIKLKEKPKHDAQYFNYQKDSLRDRYRTKLAHAKDKQTKTIHILNNSGDKTAGKGIPL